MLTVIDGQSPGGGGYDKFRIRIWDGTQSGDWSAGLVYDNQVPSGACTDTSDTPNPCTVIGGGSIVIHTK